MEPVTRYSQLAKPLTNRSRAPSTSSRSPILPCPLIPILKDKRCEEEAGPELSVSIILYIR